MQSWHTPILALMGGVFLVITLSLVGGERFIDSSFENLGCEDIVFDNCVIDGADGSSSWVCNGRECVLSGGVGGTEGEEQKGSFNCNFVNEERFARLKGRLVASWNVENINPMHYDICSGSVVRGDGAAGASSSEHYLNLDREILYCSRDDVIDNGFYEGEDFFISPEIYYMCTHEIYFNNLAGQESIEFELGPSSNRLVFAGYFDNKGILFNDKLEGPLCSVKLELDECELIPNTPPAVSVSVEPVSVNTEQDIDCIGSARDEDADIITEVEVLVEGGSGEGDYSFVEGCGDLVCETELYIPDEYTRAGDTIICKMIAFDGENWGEWGEKEVEVYNRYPEIESIDVGPNYFEVYSVDDWVKYSDIFSDVLFVNVKFSDLDEEHEVFDVEINARFFPFGEQYGRGNYEYNFSIQCREDEECISFIPIELIFPGDFVRAEVKVSDVLDGFDIEVGSVSIPGFDLRVEQSDAYNVISGTTLAANKPEVIRVWPGIDSVLIDELDRGTFVEVEIRDEKTLEKKIVHSNGVDKVIKYFDRGDLKLNPTAEIYPGVSASDLLKKAKMGNDSVNIFTLTLSDAGKYTYEATIDYYSDGNGAVKESDEFNNRIGVEFNKEVWEQKDVYNIGYVVISDLTNPKNVFDEEDEKLIEKQFAFMFAGSPLIGKMTSISELPSIVLYYNKDDFSDSTTTKVRERFRKELEKIRISKNLDLLIGVVLDDNLMIELSGETSRPNSLSSHYKVMLVRNRAGVETVLHEFGHIYTGEMGHKVELLTYDGWCQEQYNVNVCNDSSIVGADENGSPRINIWNEKREPPNGASAFDMPYNNPDLIGVGTNMGPAFFNLINDELTFPNIWIKSYEYSKLFGGLKKFFKTP